MSDLERIPEDESAFAALNAFLEDLHAGREPDRAAFLARYPELAELLECLEAVDDLRVQASGDARKGTGAAETSTLALDQTVAGDAVAAEDGSSMSALLADLELQEELGRGGMGVVYRAWQRSLQRFVAVKTIPLSHLASPSLVQRFYREARAAARVQHDHIVQIYGAGQHQGQHYLVMEYMCGGSLAEVIARGPVEPETAARWLLAVARALDHLHRHGVVHCDLKPSNILLDEKGQPHVADFGLARILMADSEITRTGEVLGTPSYMAPEQAAGHRREVGPHSDVFSLGAVLYALLTGRPPFKGATPLETLIEVLESEPVPPHKLNPRVPRDLEMIVLRCLSKKPEERYPSAAALADDLERFLKGEDVHARRPALVRRIRQWARREPALAARLAIVALALVTETLCLYAGIIDSAHYRAILGLVAPWAAVSVICQRLLGAPRLADWVRYVWALADVLFVTSILLVTGGPESPLVVAYPVMVAGAGLWFRRGLVAFVTGLSAASNAGLVLYMEFVGPGLEQPLYRHLIAIFLLLVLGGAVAYQVQRVHALARYYERRPVL